MHHKKFIFMFVAWYCVNTVRTTPISFVNKLDCGNKCNADETGIQINDHLRSLEQANDLNSDLYLPTLTGRTIPKRKKRQTNNEPLGVVISPPETTLAPDPAEATTQINDADQSTEPTLVPKDETDLTVSSEYKKAQENLLSASEQVKIKDSRIAPNDDILSDDKILLNTNIATANIQDITEIENDENILPNSTIPMSSKSGFSGEADDVSSSITETLKGTEGTVAVGVEKVAVESQDTIEVVPPISENKIAEAKPTTYDSTVTSPNAPQTSNDPIKPNSNIEIVKSDDKTDATAPEEINVKESGISLVEKTGLAVNTDIPNPKPTVIDEANNRAAPGGSTENKLNVAIVDPVKGGERDVPGKTTEVNETYPLKAPQNSGDPETVRPPSDLTHSVPSKADATGQDITKTLEAEPKQLGIPELHIDTGKSISADTIKTAEDIETTNVLQEDKEMKVIPNSPTATPPNFNNNFESRDEIHIYNSDDWDEEFTDNSSFDDPCDCGRTEIPKNYDNVVEDHSTDNIEYTSIEDVIDEPRTEDCGPTDYSTSYDNIGENHDHSDGSFEYTHHTYDNSRYIVDDFDQESDLDDIFNSDTEFNTKHDSDCDHFIELADDFNFDDIYR